MLMQKKHYVQKSALHQFPFSLGLLPQKRKMGKSSCLDMNNIGVDAFLSFFVIGYTRHFFGKHSNM